MSMYKGYTEGGATAPNAVVVYVPSGLMYRLAHVVRHSPQGFSWGHVGVGPADLACSLLADYLKEAPFPVLYQRFKIEVVAKWNPAHDWALHSEEISRWLKRHPDLLRHQRLWKHQ